MKLKETLNLGKTAETIRNYFEKLDLLPINNYTAVVIEMGIFQSFKMISSRGVK